MAGEGGGGCRRREVCGASSSVESAKFLRVVLDATMTKPPRLNTQLCEALQVLSCLQKSLHLLPRESLVQVLLLAQWAIVQFRELELECQECLTEAIDSSAAALDLGCLAAPVFPAAAEVPQPLRDFLSRHRKALPSRSPGRVLVVRETHRLGRRGMEVLRDYYSLYGEVSRVAVERQAAKSSRGRGGHQRPKSGGFGIVVMKDEDAVEEILQDGRRQQLSGHFVLVERLLPELLPPELPEPPEELLSSEHYMDMADSHEEVASTSSES